jgi:hypothetical protein
MTESLATADQRAASDVAVYAPCSGMVVAVPVWAGSRRAGEDWLVAQLWVPETGEIVGVYAPTIESRALEAIERAWQSVTSVSVEVGDSVLAGAPIAWIGDARRPRGWRARLSAATRRLRPSRAG